MDISQAGRLARITRFAETELTSHILPFWARLKDSELGGFAGQADYKGRPDRSAHKGTVLHARILWIFATAGARYRRPDWLALAKAAYRFLAEALFDPVHGGLRWSVQADGTPEDDRKHLYAQAFGIYGLSAYYAGTADEQALHLAKSLFESVEAQAADPVHGGYFESFSVNWTLLPNSQMGMAHAPKCMNAHLHLLEAYAALWAVWPAPALRDRIEALLVLLAGPAFDRQIRGFHQYFSADWRSLPAGRSYGHDIEGSWLIASAAEALGGQTGAVTRQSLAGIAEAVRRSALDFDGGVIIGERIRKGRAAAIALKVANLNIARHLHGPFLAGAFIRTQARRVATVTDRRKIWWVQAEAAVGFLDAFEQTGEARFLDAAEAVWHFITHNLIDHEDGEWRSEAYGTDRLPKASFWKCPYHNGRACLETVIRGSRLLGQ